MTPRKQSSVSLDASPDPKRAKLVDYVALGLGKAEVPLRPQKPTTESIANGTACSVRQYVKNLTPYILAG